MILICMPLCVHYESKVLCSLNAKNQLIVQYTCRPFLLLCIVNVSYMLLRMLKLINFIETLSRFLLFQILLLSF